MTHPHAIETEETPIYAEPPKLVTGDTTNTGARYYTGNELTFIDELRRDACNSNLPGESRSWKRKVLIGLRSAYYCRTWEGVGMYVDGGAVMSALERAIESAEEAD